MNRLRPATAEEARRPAGLLWEPRRRKEVWAESRTKRVLRPIRPSGTPDPHGEPGRRWGRLAGDETKSPPRCGPRSSALQSLPPHSLAFPGLPLPLPVSHPSLW